MQYSVLALLMTVIEGIALFTGLFFTLYRRMHNRHFISLLFSFTGGMMLFAAFVRFLPSSLYHFSILFSRKETFTLAFICFFAGLLATSPIDLLLSKREKSRNNKNSSDERIRKNKESHIYILLILSFCIHNFLEGIATYISFIEEGKFAFVIVATLIAHNIPEGAIIAMIVYRKTANRKEAVKMCTIAALTGPAGAIITALILPDSLTLTSLAIVKAFLSGILVNTALVELILPTSYLFNKHKVSKRGMITGMIFMAVMIILY